VFVFLPMPSTTDGLRWPHARVLLPRTRLAYVHLPNLLNDALRDRSARVFGYVAIWLEKELVMLYLQEGKVVTATVTTDGRAWQAIAIAEAVAKVPASPEFGAICFHEAADEQLAAMYWSQVQRAVDWPGELAVHDGPAVLSYLMAHLYDGLLEVAVGGRLSYCTFRDGSPRHGYFAVAGEGAVGERLSALVSASPAMLGGGTGEAPVLRLRRFGVPAVLPVQAPPALIAAYRELLRQIVKKLVETGNAQAPQVAEQARLHLVQAHPLLHHFAIDNRNLRDPVVDAPTLTATMAKWTTDVLWGAGAEGPPPEQVLAEVGRERRHLLQSAGYWEALPWRVTW
jgi:hypothetical protein